MRREICKARPSGSRGTPHGGWGWLRYYRNVSRSCEPVCRSDIKQQPSLHPRRGISARRGATRWFRGAPRIFSSSFRWLVVASSGSRRLCSHVEPVVSPRRHTFARPYLPKYENPRDGGPSSGARDASCAERANGPSKSQLSESSFAQPCKGQRKRDGIIKTGNSPRGGRVRPLRHRGIKKREGSAPGKYTPEKRGDKKGKGRRKKGKKKKKVAEETNIARKCASGGRAGVGC